MRHIATNAFEIFAKLVLDSGEFEKGLTGAKSMMSKVGSGIATGLKTAAKVGAAAIGTVSAVVTKFTKDSVSVGMEFDSAMSQVAATSGKTMDEMLNDIQTVTIKGKEFTGNLREYAQEMGATTAFSATQAAEALNYMALAGYDTTTSMEMLPNVLNLAAAGGMELATASDMVTDTQSALGLTLEETSELVDKMAKASSKSNTSVAQLGEAMLTVGGTAKTLAGGTTELSTALGILADNGVKGAEGGTALRNIILSLSAPTDKAAGALKNLGVEVFDAEGNMRPLNETFGDLNNALSTMTQGGQTQVLNTIFNKVDLKSVNALLANTAGGFADLGAAIESSGVAWDKYSDKAWTANDGLDKLIKSIATDMVDLGIPLEQIQTDLQKEYGLSADDAKAISEAVDKQLEIAESGSRWDELSGCINDAAVAAAAMADTQLDNLAGDVTLFKSALEGAKVTLSDSLTPTLRDFVSIGTDGVTELTNAFKKGGLSGAINALGPIFSRVIQKASKMIPTIIAVATELVTALASQLPTLLQAILPPLISGVTQVLTALVGQLPAIFGIISDSMPILLDAILTILPDLINTGLQIIAQLALGIADALPTLIPTIVDVVLQIVDTLIDNIDLLIDASIALIMGLADGLINAMPVLIDKIPDIVEKLVTAIVDNAPKLARAAWELIAKLRNGIGENLGKLVESAGKIVRSLTNGIFELRGKMVETAKDLLKSMVSEVKTWPDKALTWGKDMLQGFINGIKNKISDIKNAVSNVGETIKSYLHFSVPDEGPLTDYESWMPDFMKGLAHGIDQNRSMVADAVSKVAEAMRLPETPNGDREVRYRLLPELDLTHLSDTAELTGQISAVGAAQSAAAARGSAQAPSGQNGASVSYAGANINIYVNGASDSDQGFGNRLAEQLAEELARLTADNNTRMGVLTA